MPGRVRTCALRVGAAVRSGGGWTGWWIVGVGIGVAREPSRASLSALLVPASAW